MHEDGGPVFVAPVTELASCIGGVDMVPVPGEKHLIAHLGGVVDDVDGFGVPRQSRCHQLVGRVLHMTTGVSGDRFQHAGNLVKVGLHAPEAAGRERCHLCLDR